MLAEKKFTEEKAINTKTGVLIDKSGSCAVICLIIDDACYIANLGDSRAMTSSETGKNINQITVDHNPSNKIEIKRILEIGGKIYQ